MGHPMVLSVKVWALSHLLANGNLADVILFGAFLIWAVLNFKSARARDRAQVQGPDSNGEVSNGVSSHWSAAWLYGPSSPLYCTPKSWVLPQWVN
jgi:uncharacterized membrane protein